MKSLPAYGIDPKALFAALGKAGQPVVEIRYRGPTRTPVALACVCLGDSADLEAARGVIAAQSKPKPEWGRTDDHIGALAEGVGLMMTSYRGGA